MVIFNSYVSLPEGMCCTYRFPPSPTSTAAAEEHFCVEGTLAAGAIATPVVRNVLAAVVWPRQVPTANVFCTNGNMFLDSLTTKWAMENMGHGKNFGIGNFIFSEKSGKPENVVWPFMGQHHIAGRSLGEI